MEQIDVDSLADGVPQLTSSFSSFLSEVAIYCLRKQSHQSGATLKMISENGDGYRLLWKDGTAEEKRVCYTYGDPDEAVEYGATGIAILLAIHRTEFREVARAAKGGGFDYWLGPATGDGPFQEAARLEISGIMNGSKNEINSRIKRKALQTTASDASMTDAVIIVVEFGRPLAGMQRRGNR